MINWQKDIGILYLLLFFVFEFRLRTGVNLHRVDAAADTFATTEHDRNRIASLAETSVASEFDRFARNLLGALHHLDEIRNRAARQNANLCRLVLVRDRQNRTVRSILAHEPRRRTSLRNDHNQWCTTEIKFDYATRNEQIELF